MSWVKKVPHWTARLVRWVTAVLLPVGLFLAYFVAIPITRLLVLIVPGGSRRSRDRRLQTYWREPQGFSTDEADLMEPS